MMHQSAAHFHSRGRCLARLAGLLALAALAPACYSSKGKTYTAPTNPGGAGTLFSDGFIGSGTPLSSNPQWSESPAASNATLTETYAPPDYFLRIVGTSRPGSATALSVPSAPGHFPSEALTFNVNFRPSTSTDADADQAMIQIVDATSPTTVLAQAAYDATTGNVTFSIGAATPVTVGLTAGSFQTISFVIDSGLGGTWKVGATSEMNAAFGVHTTLLRLSASFASGAAASPTFDFTTVEVSNP